MNEIVINSTKLPIREYKGNRVVTFKDIDEVHGRKEGTAKRNFYTNRERFIEGVDYFKITQYEFRTAIGNMDSRQQNDVIILSESGYLMLAKSFTDDLAWKVQRELVNFYFRGKTSALVLPTEDMEPQAAYTGAQRLGDVVELAKLTARLMKDSKRIPSDILHTVGAQLEGFGVVMPDDFYAGDYLQGPSAERSAVVSSFLSEFGSVVGYSVADVYKEYLDYCRRTGNPPLKSTYAFGQQIVKLTGIKSRCLYRNGTHARVYVEI